jgi:hypothetical protein
VGLVLLLSAGGAPAQGTFQNLDFESAQIPSGTTPSWAFSTGVALPGWAASFSNSAGSYPWDMVIYDSLSLQGPMLGIIDEVYSYQHYQAIQGRYSAFIFGGYDPTRATSVTISQTGLVPTGAYQITMDVNAWYGFTVALDGQPINMAPVATFPSFTVYGSGDISALAGRTVQLSITAPPGPNQLGPPNGVLIDDITFLTVPEPSAYTLSALSALLWRVLVRRHRGSN